MEQQHQENEQRLNVLTYFTNQNVAYSVFPSCSTDSDGDGVFIM